MWLSGQSMDYTGGEQTSIHNHAYIWKTFPTETLSKSLHAEVKNMNVERSERSEKVASNVKAISSSRANEVKFDSN